MSGRKSSVGPCLMPTCPLDVASIFDVYANEKDSSQTLVLPLQAPKRALFASGAAMAVAAWRWRLVGKHARSRRVQVESRDLLGGRREALKLGARREHGSGTHDYVEKGR